MIEKKLASWVKPSYSHIVDTRSREEDRRRTHALSHDGSMWLVYLPTFQENYNTHVEHTQSAIPCSPTMKGIPACSLLVKVFSGCVPKVCANNLRYLWLIFMVNVGKYTIYGLSGLGTSTCHRKPPRKQTSTNTCGYAPKPMVIHPWNFTNAKHDGPWNMYLRLQAWHLFGCLNVKFQGGIQNLDNVG